MVVAQRQRERLRQQQAMLVARAHEEERAWVAGELHDDVLQRIALVRAELESLWGAPSVPDAAAVRAITPVYRQLLEEERRHSHPVQAIDASTRLLGAILGDAGITYDQFVWSLAGASA